MVSKSRIGGHPTQDESFDFSTLINSPYKEDSSMASPGYVTHDQLRDFGDKFEERFEKRFDKMDARMDRMDANIAEMSKGIVALTAKVDHIPMQLENQKLQTKLDIEGMLKEQNKEIKSDARYRTTITIAGIGLVVALIQAAPAIFSAMTSAP
ncbi:hypothetical protein [Oceanospirillum maris]|uniref:hypothetical protein n=1 Tax=Oceanospirillum maris TaxID=64977 RepID=UPI0004282E35|nr:hypothetical protein [Oceanospirillum maris]